MKPTPMRGDPRKHNQQSKCAFHGVKGTTLRIAKVFKVFIDQLVQEGHLKEFVDQEKTRRGEVEIRPNPRFD